MVDSSKHTEAKDDEEQMLGKRGSGPYFLALHKEGREKPKKSKFCYQFMRKMELNGQRFSESDWSS